MNARTSFALGLACFLAACSSDPEGTDLTDASGIPALDAGSGDTGPVKPDSGPGVVDSGVDAPPPDTIAPMAITDLAATATGHTSIALTWTAPTDPPNGKATSYELRRSKTPITNDAEFTAGTLLPAPSPKAMGTAETFTATALEPETTYYFAIKAKDGAGNVGPMSNVASATTKPRATLLLSEVAMLEASGTDFVELVVTKAGNVKDIEVRQSASPSLLYKLGDLDVALGDRIVVHLTGVPGPTGFAQEDTTKSKTSSTETTASASDQAFDVYSAVGTTGLPSTDDLVSVVDGTTTVDAVAYSARDGDAAATTMTAFAAAKTASAWTFTAAPVDGTNDCETQREAVAVSTSLGTTSPGACGRFPTGIAAGKSINRVGTTDTNGKKDWYVAARTPGLANAALPDPIVTSATATSATTVEVRFSQEIDGTTVAAGVFTGSGITVDAATLSEVAFITLTTSTQNGPHTIGVDAALKTIYGTPVTSTIAFCGYQPLGGNVVITEINPIIPANASGGELIELQATRAGLLDGFSVRVNATAASTSGNNVATFPNGLCVALGDVLVVHAQPPADIVALSSESLAKDQFPAATYSAHYDGAWDIRGTTQSLSNFDSVVFVRNGQSVYVDAVAYTNANGNSTEAAAFIPALAYAQSLGLWTPADCGGAACDGTSTPTAEGVAASMVGIGTSAAGASLQRSSPGAAATAASWSVAASTWGN